MTLKEYQITKTIPFRAMEKIVKTNIIKRCSRRKAGDMAADSLTLKFARITIAIAFQRIRERMERSMKRSPGICASSFA